MPLLCVCTVFSCSVVSSCLQSPWTPARQAPLSLAILYARKLEWVTMPSSRGPSQPRDRTQVSCIAGGFFTTREAQEYWRGKPIPSPSDLPKPGIKPGTAGRLCQLSYHGSPLSYISKTIISNWPIDTFSGLFLAIFYSLSFRRWGNAEIGP